MKYLRADFPILKKQIHSKSLIYLDSAASAQKPQQVLDAMHAFYAEQYANIHRGVYALTEQATEMYEAARANVARFIGAQPHEIIFTRSTTESINMVAAAWADQHIHAGDEIVLSELEHHSNLLPWQQVALRRKAKLIFIPVNPDGTLDLTHLNVLISSKTKLVTISHVSNALGTHNDIDPIIRAAHAVGAKVLIDAAQSAPHQLIDVRTMQCDFLAFSGHKMLGPTGIGVLYAAQSLHDQMAPYQYGGGMVYEADFHNATFLKMPHRMEAGTPAIAQAIGLSAAIDYLREKVNFQDLQQHEASLCARLIQGLGLMPHVRILGPIEQLKERGHLVSFAVNGFHSHDVAAYLDTFGICVRAGHQCAQPLAKKLGITSSVRASFYLYNTIDEVDALLEALRKI